MKLSKIKVYQVDIDLSQPFTIALGTEEAVQEIIVKVIDDQDNTGWGEASPAKMILGDTSQSTIAAIDLMANRLLGEDPRRIERIVHLMDDTVYGNTSAKAALDIAIHDLIGKAWGEPLWRLLGGYGQERVETDFSIGIKDAEEMVKEALKLKGEGFKALKVKVGTDFQEDIKKIKLIREAVGENIRLRIDANQGWTRQQAIKALNGMADYDIEFAEQPVKAHDITGLAQVRRSVPIPIMADESVHQPEDAIRVIEKEAVDYINIKLMKSGGLWKAQRIAAIAEAAGVECMIGGMIETGVSTTAAVQFAAATQNVKFRDLDLDLSLENRLVMEGGSELKGGYRTIPGGPGLGILQVDEVLLGNPIKVYSE